MAEIGKKLVLGSYRVIHSAAERRVAFIRWSLMDLVMEDDALRIDTYRAVRYSQEPAIAKLGERLKPGRPRK